MRLQVEELLEELVYRRWAIPRPASWQPPLDLHETPDAYLIEIDLPGVAPEEVRVLVGERSLTISGQRQAAGPESAFFNRCERTPGPFHRALDLPLPIDPEKVCVEYRYGTYRVVLPKRPPDEKRLTRASAGADAPEQLRVVPVVVPPAKYPGES